MDIVHPRVAGIDVHKKVVASPSHAGIRDGQREQLTGTQKRTDLFDMEVIVRRQNQEHCASITCMIRHYVAPKGCR